MQLKNIRMKDAGRAIEDRLDFGVRASKYMREETGIQHSLRGYSPKDTLGFYGPQKIDRFQLPADEWEKMTDQMERLHVAYTVIAWVDSNGRVRMPNYRYSVTTTQHQHTTAAALGVPWGSMSTDRVILTDDVAVGRPGW